MHGAPAHDRVWQPREPVCFPAGQLRRRRGRCARTRLARPRGGTPRRRCDRPARAAPRGDRPAHASRTPRRSALRSPRTRRCIDRPGPSAGRRRRASSGTCSRRGSWRTRWRRSETGAAASAGSPGGYMDGEPGPAPLRESDVKSTGAYPALAQHAHGVVGIDAVRPAAVGDDVGPPRKLWRLRREGLDRGRDRASDVPGAVLLLRANGHVPHGTPQLRHARIRQAIHDPRPLPSRAHQSGSCEKPEVMRGVLEALADFAGDLVNRALALGQDVDDLGPAPVSERARLLAWAGAAWHIGEFAVAIAAGVAASSIALIGFGIDSLIEAMAGTVVVWLFTGRRRHSRAAERRAQQLIAASFAP